jgi:hypothetical protein
MLPLIAAAALVVLGIVLAVLGFMDGSGNMLLIVAGLIAVVAGGALGLAARRQAAP